VSLSHPDRNLVALGVRQPWAELLVAGIKTIEVRSQETNRRGTIYVYATKKVDDTPPAIRAVARHGLHVESLPKGLLVGTVKLVDSRPSKSSDASAACLPRSYLQGRFSWKLQNACRLTEPLAVRFLPYGVWFYPYRRRNQEGQ
jgi:hypothetical protein